MVVNGPEMLRSQLIGGFRSLASVACDDQRHLGNLGTVLALYHISQCLANTINLHTIGVNVLFLTLV